MKPLTIFRGSTGLNTKIDPTRLYSSNGIKDLAVVGDIDISDTGRISRRKGYTNQISGLPIHSLFCDKGDCLFVTGSSLCLLNADYSYEPLATVTPDARVSYTEINGRIYWCNGHEKGYVVNKANGAWVQGVYVGADTKRNLTNPPVGSIVAYYKNRMFVAQNNVLWYSEPGAFSSFDLVRGFFQYTTKIRMARAVENGLFISTEKNTYSLVGKTPLEFVQTKVAPYPAIQWSDCKLKGSLAFPQHGGKSIIENGNNAAMWLSDEGICYGGADGKFYNLTQDKIADFPTGLTGSGLVHNGRYVGLINP